MLFVEFLSVKKVNFLQLSQLSIGINFTCPLQIHLLTVRFNALIELFLFLLLFFLFSWILHLFYFPHAGVSTVMQAWHKRFQTCSASDATGSLVHGRRRHEAPGERMHRAVTRSLGNKEMLLKDKVVPQW